MFSRKKECEVVWAYRRIQLVKDIYGRKLSDSWKMGVHGESSRVGSRASSQSTLLILKVLMLDFVLLSHLPIYQTQHPYSIHARCDVSRYT